MSKQSFRIFSHSNDALCNGSFIKLIYSPATLRGYSTFINGDFMGLEKLSRVDGSYDCKLTQLTSDPELHEFSREQFKQMAPECCR